MNLAEVIEKVLKTGVLSMQVERQMHRLLKTCPMDEQSVTAIDQLIEALAKGAIQPVA
jgi:hypothetical protein